MQFQICSGKVPGPAFQLIIADKFGFDLLDLRKDLVCLFAAGLHSSELHVITLVMVCLNLNGSTVVHTIDKRLVNAFNIKITAAGRTYS